MKNRSRPGEKAAPAENYGAASLDGAELLRNVRDWLATYICTVTSGDLDLLALWATHTHLAFETYTTPRLQIDSPVPGSGKTTCFEHLQRLCLRAVQMASVSSPALLTRLLDAELRTILIDEVDRALSPDKEGVGELLAVLNSGYKRGATRPVLVSVKGGGWEPKEMPTFSPVAMAGNNPNLPDDTRSRSIRVLLLPDLGNTVEDSDWELIEENAIGLHDEIARWADQVRDEVRTTRPELPAGITGRFREKWGPLKRVAVAAGGRWPAAVDQMALSDKDEYEMDKEDGLVREAPAAVLLKHMYELWPETDGEPHHFAPTVILCNRLTNEYPNVWGKDGPIGKDLTARRLGSMLAKGYKIHSKGEQIPEIHSKRETRDGPRGYLRSDFTRAWGRMGVTPPQQPGASGASAVSGADSDGVAPDSPGAPDAPDSERGAPGVETLFFGLRKSEPRLVPCESGTDCGNTVTGGGWCPTCLEESLAYTATLDVTAADNGQSQDAPAQCHVCSADLWAPDSQERGTCTKCYRQAAGKVS